MIAEGLPAADPVPERMFCTRRTTRQARSAPRAESAFGMLSAKKVVHVGALQATITLNPGTPLLQTPPGSISRIQQPGPPQNITGFAPYLPSNAGGALWGSPLGTAHALSPWTGFAVLCGYAAVLVGLAAWRLRRRDVVRTIRPHRA